MPKSHKRSRKSKKTHEREKHRDKSGHDKRRPDDRHRHSHKHRPKKVAEDERRGKTRRQHGDRHHGRRDSRPVSGVISQVFAEQEPQEQEPQEEQKPQIFWEKQDASSSHPTGCNCGDETDSDASSSSDDEEHERLISQIRPAKVHYQEEQHDIPQEEHQEEHQEEVYDQEEIYDQEEEIAQWRKAQDVEKPKQEDTSGRSILNELVCCALVFGVTQLAGIAIDRY